MVLPRCQPKQNVFFVFALLPTPSNLPVVSGKQKKLYGLACRQPEMCPQGKEGHWIPPQHELYCKNCKLGSGSPLYTDCTVNICKIMGLGLRGIGNAGKRLWNERERGWGLERGQWGEVTHKYAPLTGCYFYMLNKYCACTFFELIK